MEQERKCNETGCSGDCSSCKSAKKEPESFIEAANKYSKIKNVIGVSSGKGGVGKSMVTAMLAVLMSRKGYKVGILDADITGPSIPKMFGINSRAKMNDKGILPEVTAGGIKIMSCNLLLENPDAPVVWRGPVLAGAVKQFWTDVFWDEVDFLFVDMPPGTGDVPLTVYQSLPINGAVIVTTPQDLVSLIVKKAYNMANMMNIPVLGLVENMSYIKCPDCGKEIKLFGESHIEEVAEKFGYDLLARIPMDSKLAALVDRGMIELMENDYMDKAAQAVIEKLNLTQE